MMLPFLLADGAPVDPTLSPVISLVGSLGSSGAAVFVAYLFLQFLKSAIQSFQAAIQGLFQQVRDESEKRDDAWRTLADRHLEVMRQCVDTMRQSNDALRAFAVSTNGICKVVDPARRTSA